MVAVRPSVVEKENNRNSGMDRINDFHREDQVEYKSLYLPDKIQWDKESYTDTFGRLEITPLERGFGRTLGNALRRVLLSSLEGIAPVSMKLDGAKHEFSALSGIVEDVTEIVLNVKSLIVCYDGSEPQTIRLNRKKKRKKNDIVTASELKCENSVTIVNKEQRIAELTEGGELNLEIRIEKGKGFITADEWANADTAEEEGVIFLDSWFCPVTQINFEVQDARVGDKTDYDKLTMNIHTDGSITPEEVIKRACDILIKHFEMIFEGKEFEEKEDSDTTSSIVSKDKAFDEITLADIGISTKIANILIESGISSLAELLEKFEDELLKIKGFGPSSLHEIQELLDEKELKLKK